MSLFGVLMTYACSWWLVLFMVLPWKVSIPEKAEVGHAASAPVNPMLKKKLLIATVLALLPTLMLYILIGREANAEEIYSTKRDCVERVDHHARADVKAADTDATIKDGGNIMGGVGDTHVGLFAPARDYSEGGQPDLRFSDVYVGSLRVKQDGGLDYNGRPIGQQPLDGKPCN